eukprot:Clim_evm60s225 gene=Clim_evmTU60s225
MVRKKIDVRVRTLIENSVMSGHRSFIVMVGDYGKNQIPNLHYMLTKASTQGRPSVLWCYKKDLGFSTHRKKRMKEIKKKIQRGLRDADSEDPFELFIASTEIRYTYYSETHKILGNTYGMCVLQDFEALTPNLLARTVETVQGGGLVVILLRSMKSLKQLYHMNMDVHRRYRTESHLDVTGRFNERFILSLSNCETCLLLDDQLSVLPLSSHILGLQPKRRAEVESKQREQDDELKILKDSLEGAEPAFSLSSVCTTLDQAKALLVFIDAISEKTLRSTVALTAGRGRGKSASMGLAVAAAIAYGYSNLFVTSPSPENLKTFFEFVFKGLDAMGYQEHVDYTAVKSVNPEFNNALIRINIYKNHRQTVQYVRPQDHQQLAQAELLVIDEAAAIPLPIVKKLLGNYLVFMSSTINGYEGTGRSLSLKLLSNLRQQSATTRGASTANDGSQRRTLRELTLEEPIRYRSGDPVEKWLNNLLCLNISEVKRVSSSCPHPSECELYYVNRDTLFSYHRASEAFLQRMVTIYVASHYRNTPNDLQMMSDAPAHHLFVLLGPLKEDSTALPEVLCIIQVALEGAITRDMMQRSLARGVRMAGDLIPWTISQQFQDHDFGALSGVRIVRIATHPDYTGMGYGRRAMELLEDYYGGNITLSMEAPKDKRKNSMKNGRGDEDQFSSDVLHEEVLEPRKELPPLLQRLDHRKAEPVDYIGVSYGLTKELFKFYNRIGYVPVYLRQTANELTGEHTCIMLKGLDGASVEDRHWHHGYFMDFRSRLIHLLSYEFKDLGVITGLSLMHSIQGQSDADVGYLPAHMKKSHGPFGARDLHQSMTSWDLNRLNSYARNLVDYHMILDLVPKLAEQFFKARMDGGVSLSPLQSAILLGIGLQHKSVTELETELGVTSTQLLANFNKIMKKFENYLQQLERERVDRMLPDEGHGGKDSQGRQGGLAIADLDEVDGQDAELEQEGKAALRNANASLVMADGKIDLHGIDQSYEINSDDEGWQETLAKGVTVTSGGNVSIKRKATDKRSTPQSEPRKKRSKDGHGSSKKSKKSKKSAKY